MKINIVKPFLPSLSEIESEFTECLSSGMVTNNSQYVRQLETDLGKFYKSKLKPLTFSNGEMALFSLIQAYKLKLGYGPLDSFDVLVPSFTFAGTINAILMNNLRPIFCDVDGGFILDIKKLKLNYSSLVDGLDPYVPNIKMMVCVGAYGNLPNIELIREFSDENNIEVIFDNAPAFGSTYKNKFTCNHGFSEIYSFHASKIFSTMEGGGAITNDPEIHNTLIKLRDFGQYEKVRGNVDVPGLNSKMQEISALVGIKNLEKVDFILKNRKNNINRYRKFFGSKENSKFFNVMDVSSDVNCTYLYYPIVLKEEATPFVNYMQENNIMVRRYYTAVHELDLYKNKYMSLDLTNTNEIKDKVVSIPIHTIMKDEEMDYLFETVNNFFKNEKSIS